MDPAAKWGRYPALRQAFEANRSRLERRADECSPPFCNPTSWLFSKRIEMLVACGAKIQHEELEDGIIGLADVCSTNPRV